MGSVNITMSSSFWQYSKDTDDMGDVGYDFKTSARYYGATSSKYVSVDYRLHVGIAGYSPILDDPGTTIESIDITAKIAPLSNNTEEWKFVRIYAPEKSRSAIASDGYAGCETGSYTTGKITDEGEVSVRFSSAVDISNILKNGIAFVQGRNLSVGGSTTILYSVQEISVVANYANVNEPPKIKPTVYDASTRPITQSVTLEWVYSQAYDVPQKYVDVSVSVQTEDAYVQIINKQECTEPSITIEPEQYPQILASQMNAQEYWITLHFKVRAYSESGAVSDWTSAYSWILTFPTVSNLSPSGGQTVLSDGIINLEWASGFKKLTGGMYEVSPPTEYDIEYSADAGESWRAIETQFTAPSENGVFYCAVPQGTFPAGIINWRVRAYANGYTVDLWSQESFIVRVQASTSSVSCDGKPHPTVSWSASSQIAYQVRFADYDSGAVYGSAASHVIPYVYADGAYPVQVRTQAADGMWSPWTELEYVTIRNTAPAGSLMLTAVKTRHAVALEWSGTEFGTYILYRNGIPVYIGSGRSYTDVGANGNASYYVRGIVNPNCLQSNTAEISAVPATDCMYDLVSRTWIPLKYSTSPRARGYSETANVVYKYYAGRKYPVAYVDGTAERQLNVSYVFKTMEDADRVRAALGHTVIYKDTRGRRIIGIFGTMGETVERRLVSHTISIVQVDYNEEVRYET